MCVGGKGEWDAAVLVCTPRLPQPVEDWGVGGQGEQLGGRLCHQLGQADVDRKDS
jgi:hypothetical protein